MASLDTTLPISGAELLLALPPDVRDQLAEPAVLAARLTSWYGAATRHYHTLAHLGAMLGEWRSLREAEIPEASARPKEWAAAILFHDAVYEPAMKDNEARSATLARRDAPRFFPGVSITGVTRLIELTAKHGAELPANLTAEERLFLDMDMAILGAAPDEYRRYADSVRAEFAPAVGPYAFKWGRTRFLRALLEGERIFLSDHYHERLDARARENIRSEL